MTPYNLAWTMMNASGNQGDDIRALRLCEMQSYELLHPNGEAPIFTILGLQSDQEHKTKSKAMRTISQQAKSAVLSYSLFCGRPLIQLTHVS